MQQSISNNISCSGIGIHSGKLINVTLKQAKPNTGIIFIRTDVKSVNNIIEASYVNVSDTMYSTTIKNSNNISVSTIEHFMAAIWGCKITNLIIEIDGLEMPIMDGSSKHFVEMIEKAGVIKQNAPKKYIKILKEFYIKDGNAEIIGKPANFFSADFTIEFANKVIGKQQYKFLESQSFQKDIAPSRTFGFVHELNYLKNKGLAQGASLENSIGIGENEILNSEGLRFNNEFVRHKLLDLIGDLYLSGANIIGSVISTKSGHTTNSEFIKKLITNPTLYKIVQ